MKSHHRVMLRLLGYKVASRALAIWKDQLTSHYFYGCGPWGRGYAKEGVLRGYETLEMAMNWASQNGWSGLVYRFRIAPAALLPLIHSGTLGNLQNEHYCMFFGKELVAKNFTKVQVLRGSCWKRSSALRLRRGDG